MARIFLLGFADRLAGFIIGAVVGCAMLAIAVAPAAEKFSADVKGKIHASYTATRVVPFIFSRVPGLKYLRGVLCK
jgi:hypothetical protein